MIIKNDKEKSVYLPITITLETKDEAVTLLKAVTGHFGCKGVYEILNNVRDGLNKLL
jgi:hypothetical protein